MTDPLTALKDQVQKLSADFGVEIENIYTEANKEKKCDPRQFFSKSIQALCNALADMVPDDKMVWLPKQSGSEVQLLASVNDYTSQIIRLNASLNQSPNFVTKQLCRRNDFVTAKLLVKIQNLLAQSLDMQMKDTQLGLKEDIVITDQQEDDAKPVKNQDLALDLTKVGVIEKKACKPSKSDAININDIRETPCEGVFKPSSTELVEFPTQEVLKTVNKKELINLQIGGIQLRSDKKSYSRFNFLLTNGLRQDVDIETWDLDTRLIAQDAIIQQIQYCVQLKDGFLLGVRFLDAQGNILVDGGKFHNVDRKHFQVRKVELQMNERVCGFKARVDPTKPVYLFDIQWKIAKIIGE